ncbi:MAG: hypothetical protein WAQ05_19855 [Rubrivivax sp.]
MIDVLLVVLPDTLPPDQPSGCESPLRQPLPCAWSDTRRRLSAALAPAAQVQAKRVSVVDGPVASSAGITAGIDLALHRVQDAVTEQALHGGVCVHTTLPWPEGLAVICPIDRTLEPVVASGP